MGLVVALFLPSICSAQLLIFHENWHGLGSSKARIVDRGQHRRSVAPPKQKQKQILHSAPVAASSADQSVLERGHPPVRVADHRYHSPEVVDAPVYAQVKAVEEPALTPTIHYDVIESPFRQPYREETLHFRSKHHPPITQREGPRDQRAVIPNTMQMPVWKTPYSYGYFGTSGKKYWYQHHGYRDRRTEWIYR